MRSLLKKPARKSLITADGRFHACLSGAGEESNTGKSRCGEREVLRMFQSSNEVVDDYEWKER